MMKRNSVTVIKVTGDQTAIIGPTYVIEIARGDAKKKLKKFCSPYIGKRIRDIIEGQSLPGKNFHWHVIMDESGVQITREWGEPKTEFLPKAHPIKKTENAIVVAPSSDGQYIAIMGNKWSIEWVNGKWPLSDEEMKKVFGPFAEVIKNGEDPWCNDDIEKVTVIIKKNAASIVSMYPVIARNGVFDVNCWDIPIKDALELLYSYLTKRMIPRSTPRIKSVLEWPTMKDDVDVKQSKKLITREKYVVSFEIDVNRVVSATVGYEGIKKEVHFITNDVKKVFVDVLKGAGFF